MSSMSSMSPMSSTPTLSASPAPSAGPHAAPHAALHHPDRWLAAVSVAAGGLLHVPLIPDHLREAPYVGALFIALAVVSVVLAAALVVRDSTAVWVAVVVVMAAALAAFLLSRTVGLPQIGDDVGNWRGESLGLPCITAEALGMVVGLGALASRARQLLRSH
jgi:hypothetical protein